MSAQGDVKTLHAAPFSLPATLECALEGACSPQFQVFAPQHSLLTTAASCQQGNMVSSCDMSTHSFPLNSIILVRNLLQTKNNLGWLMVFPRPLHMGLIRAGRDYRGILSGPLHPHVPNPLPQISLKMSHPANNYN